MSGQGDDAAFMRQALEEAEKGLGRVAPNPSVGCAIVADGKIIGLARSGDGGRPHAETRALEQAGQGARGATAYVTLEPCGHFGKTPPCVDALIAAGIKRVVIACRDPNQQGNTCLEKLRAAGIAVELGLCEAQATALNEGFFTVLAENRPMVTLKLATSLDGRIAARTGASCWITGESARARGREQRARHDAIMVGIGTVLADDPLLTVRIPGHDFQPVRIVIDPALRTPPDGKLAATTAQGPVWLLCDEKKADAARREKLAARAIDIVPLPAGPDGILSPRDCLAALARRGITRLLVEGGGTTAAHLIAAGLVDRLLWFRAPILLGGDGLPACGPLGLDAPGAAPALVLEDRTACDQDLLEIWRIKR